LREIVEHANKNDLHKEEEIARLWVSGAIMPAYAGLLCSCAHALKIAFELCHYC
jgi:hypothetical protein